MENEPIKIGRVSRSIEKAVEVSFQGSCFVYLGEEKLDALAKSFPSSYLRRVEGMSEIIKKPSFAAYDKNGNTLFIIKEYVKDGVFSLLGMSLSQSENGWEAGDLFKVNEEKALEIDKKAKIIAIA